MEYKLPDKSLLEKHSLELGNDKKYYNLSKLIYQRDFNNKLVFPIGIDNEKEKYYIDLEDKSGLLIAGETGSGKSIFLNSIIVSLLLKNTPEELQFIFIDPRNVELSLYNGIPHMLSDVISDKDKSITALKNIISMMEERVELFVANGAKNIQMYNESNEKKLPQVLVVIDEGIDVLDDDETKDLINEILCNGYKLGIHLMLATNSHFKSNFDMKTIKAFNYIVTFDLVSEEQANYIKIDGSNLLSVYGEALVKRQNNEVIDIQAPYVSDNDIKEVVDFIKNQN